MVIIRITPVSGCNAVIISGKHKATVFDLGQHPPVTFCALREVQSVCNSQRKRQMKTGGKKSTEQQINKTLDFNATPLLLIFNDHNSC